MDGKVIREIEVRPMEVKLKSRGEREGVGEKWE